MASVLFFSCSPKELGWAGIESLPQEIQDHLARFVEAMAIDFADRCSEQAAFRVTWCETVDDGPITPGPGLSRKKQSRMPLRDRISEALREHYEAGENARVIVFLGRNPLYPVEYLLRGVELLDQEDDVIVVGEARGSRDRFLPIWIATKCFHPELFEWSNDEIGKDMFSPDILARANALLVPYHPVRDINALDDLSLLYHEIEREVLLKRWYPQRSYEMLQLLEHRGIIEEVSR